MSGVLRGVSALLSLHRRPKERYRMKTLLAAEENLFPNVFNCILSAIIPLMQHNSAEGCAMQ